MLRNFRRSVIHNRRLTTVIIGGLLLILVTWIDKITGRLFDLSIFYLFPIFAITWFWGTRWGIITMFLAIGAWYYVDYYGHVSEVDQKIIFWNVGVRSGFFVLFLYFLNQIKNQEGRLQRLAGLDALTGLANRRSFYETANMEIHKARRFGSIFTIVYIDVDNFKTINDTYGHNTGDAVLRIIGNTMRQNTRIVDLVARMGGDEFVILFPETNAADAKQAVQKVRNVLDQSMENHHWPVTFSIGVVTFNQPPVSMDVMLEMVDHAMYTVKKAAKNNVLFEESGNMLRELESQYITNAPLA